MLVEGVVFCFADQRVIEAPDEIAEGRTRRSVLLQRDADATRLRSMAVRVRDGKVFLLLPSTLHAEPGERLRLFVEPVPDVRATSAPPDLTVALRECHITLHGLPKHELRHLFSMIREARDPDVRAARIASVVQRLQLTHVSTNDDDRSTGTR